MTFNKLKYFMMVPLVALGLKQTAAQSTAAQDNVETYSVNLSIEQLLQDSTLTKKDRLFVAQQFTGKESPNHFNPYAVSVLLPESLLDTTYQYDVAMDSTVTNFGLPENVVDSLGPNDFIGARYTYTSAIEGNVTLADVLKGTNDRSKQRTYRFGKELLERGFEQEDPCGFQWSSDSTVKAPENEFHVAPAVFMNPSNNTHTTPLSSVDEVFFKNTLASHTHTDSTLPGFLTFDITYNIEDSTVTKVAYTVHLKKSKNVMYTWGQISNPLSDNFEFDLLNKFVEHVSATQGEVDQTILCPFDEKEPEEEAKEHVNKPVTLGVSGIAGADAYGIGPSASVSIGDHVNVLLAYHFGGAKNEYDLRTDNIYEPVEQGPIKSSFFQESTITDHLDYNAFAAATFFPAGGHFGFGPSVQLATESTDSYWANYQVDTQLNGDPLPGNPDKIPTALGENGFTQSKNDLVVAGVGGVVQYVLDNGITFTGGATYGLRELNPGINGTASVNVPLNIFSGDKNE